MTGEAKTELAYIGPTGGGLGFKLAGVAVLDCDSPQELVPKLRQLKEEGVFKIIFVDEGLAADVLAEVERLNEEALPAIVLLPNPSEPLNVAQEKMNNLVVKAVGSDILN